MKKILIIEDEETIRNELKTLLENSGYEVLMLEKFTARWMRFYLCLMGQMIISLNHTIQLFYYSEYKTYLKEWKITEMICFMMI